METVTRSLGALLEWEWERLGKFCCQDLPPTPILVPPRPMRTPNHPLSLVSLNLFLGVTLGGPGFALWVSKMKWTAVERTSETPTWDHFSLCCPPEGRALQTVLGRPFGC